MNRRRFLGSLVGGAAASLVGARGSAAGARAGDGCGRTSYPEVHALTTPTVADPFVDARPAFSPDGQRVLFMRGPGPSGEPSNLYTVSIDGGAAQQIEPVGCPPNLSLTRPDWSWRRDSYEIAFAGDLPAGGGTPAQSNIYLLDVASSDCRLLLQGFPGANQVYSYPSWYPRGHAVAVTNYWFEVNQAGCSEKPDPRQFLLRQGVDGDASWPLTSPKRIWPGMSSVAQHPLTGHPLIAFAGERPIPDGTYCQDDNQIWIRWGSGRLRPVDGLSGRSPWWSPSGKLIAFESNRCPEAAAYQIFVQDPFRPQWILPVTPPDLSVQHAKWSPDGRRLTFAYQAGTAGWGIAYIDLGDGDADPWPRREDKHSRLGAAAREA